MPPTAESKTEKPTQRKRQRARQEGQVAQSAEVNNVLVLLAAVGCLAVFGGRTWGTLTGQMTEWLSGMAGPELTVQGAVTVLRSSGTAVLRAAAPIMVCSLVVGLLCSVAQTGIIWSPKKLKPNWKAIDPINGAKQTFSLSALQKAAIALLKLIIIAAIAFTLLRNRLDCLQALVGKSVWGMMHVTCTLCLSLLGRILVAMLGVALLDYAYQRWRHEKRLMMSKGEMKEELKREEGDPHVRARRSRARRSLVRRMMKAVPDADVVVTNPTEIAVALQWDQEAMSAPRVVAKGRKHMAERIKKLAREHGVPVIERKLVARALYQAVEVGMEIPPKLYYAVAEVLAFVLKQRDH